MYKYGVILSVEIQAYEVYRDKRNNKLLSCICIFCNIAMHISASSIIDFNVFCFEAATATLKCQRLQFIHHSAQTCSPVTEREAVTA